MERLELRMVGRVSETRRRYDRDDQGFETSTWGRGPNVYGEGDGPRGLSEYRGVSEV